MRLWRNTKCCLCGTPHPRRFRVRVGDVDDRIDYCSVCLSDLLSMSNHRWLHFERLALSRIKDELQKVMFLTLPADSRRILVLAMMETGMLPREPTLDKDGINVRQRKIRARSKLERFNKKQNFGGQKQVHRKSL